MFTFSPDGYGTLDQPVWGPSMGVFKVLQRDTFYFSLIFLSCNPISCKTINLFGTLYPGDQNLAERVANVLTSLPFIALGIQAPRWYFAVIYLTCIEKKKLNIFVISVYLLYWECRKSLNTKLYANSLIGVGVASSLYHSSRGKLRQFLRWTDYTMIATATVVSQG